MSPVASVILTFPPPLLTSLPLFSALCVFLGYSAHHKGYHCLDLQSNRIIVSHHVIFDEASFPFAEQQTTPTPADFEFNDYTNPVPAPIGLSSGRA